ncbi:unnamed protein product [Camellia sinensis]
MKPNSIKTRFAYGFLRALNSLNKNKPSSPSSPKVIFRRCRMIKLAADASMASAVGSRRAWSRAVLCKIRCQRALAMRGRIRSGGFRRKSGAGKGFGVGRTDGLRKLVPGGGAMDLCSLLDETAHYIKCLTTQRRRPELTFGLVLQVQRGGMVLNIYR